MATAPEGFTQLPVEGGRAILRADLATALERAGAHRPWRLALSTPEEAGATGRGPRTLVPLEGDGRVLVKKCLRGGWLARVNRSRYASSARFLRELDVGRRAEAAGCPVIPTLGVVLRGAGIGLEAWSMSSYMEGSQDLSIWMGRLSEPAEAQALLEQVVEVIAMLRREGLYHRDLNLGNVLARAGGAPARWEVRVIDLDRARWFGRPLTARLAGRMTRRFERSWRKVLGVDGGVAAVHRAAAYRRVLGG